MVGVQILTASEWVHFLCTVQLPERSPGCKSRLGKYNYLWTESLNYLLPVYEEWGFPGEEDDDVEQIHPVRAEGVWGDVRGEVHVAARDDIEELAAGSQHLQPVHKLRAPLQNVFLWVGLKEVSYRPPHAHIHLNVDNFAFQFVNCFYDQFIFYERGLTFSPDGNQVNVFARVILIMRRSAVIYITISASVHVFKESFLP